MKRRARVVRRMTAKGLFVLLWLSLTIAGCTGFLERTGATSTGERAPITTMAAPEVRATTETTATVPRPTKTTGDTPTPKATATTAGPTPTHAADPPKERLLPAPLFYLADGQIMRLDADGQTMTQITNEAEPVIDFDVSPAGSRLAYVSGNDLIEADADGGGRVVKVQGEAYDEGDAAARVTTRISHPRFSPDGSRLAFGLNGVNLMPAGEAAGNYQVLQASDPYPEPDNLPDEEPIRFFWPLAWSPDGNRLLLAFAYWPEAGGLAIKDLNGGGLVDVSNHDTIINGDWEWGPGGESAFLASNALDYGAPGLARVDATTGESQTLIKGMPAAEGSGAENVYRLFQAPHLTAGGELLLFARSATGADDAGPEGYQMMRATTDDGELNRIRDDAFALGSALWAEDDSGVVVVQESREQANPSSGEMLWAPAGAGSIVELAARGSWPQWGGAMARPAGAMPPSEELATLANHFLRTLTLEEQDGIREAHVIRLDTAGGPRWLAHTVGLRSFEPLQRHVVAIYGYRSGKWQEEARLAFAEGGDLQTPPAPDYVGEGGVRQVFVEPEAVWIVVDGGVGAHGGTFHLLQYDGESLSVALGHGNGFPGVGQVEDLNGDGRQEVILNTSDAYVFCYACGVRLINYEMWRWDGSALAPVSLTPLPETDPAAELNNRAIALAQADLWKEARALIAQVTEAPPNDTTVAWNAALVRLTANGREAAIAPYPLLGHVFYGDYTAAVNIMRTYEPSRLFSQETPLVAGTPAEGWVDALASRLQTFSERALAAPDLAQQAAAQRAAVYFLRGWAAYLADPGSRDALAYVERAAELAPNDPLYGKSVAHLRQ